MVTFTSENGDSDDQTHLLRERAVLPGQDSSTKTLKKGIKTIESSYKPPKSSPGHIKYCTLAGKTYPFFTFITLVCPPTA